MQLINQVWGHVGTLSHLNNKFYFCATSRVESSEAQKAGLKFDPTTLRWVTINFDKARALRGYANGSAERKLKNHFITSLTPPECIVYPDHLAPHSWQIESAWHMLTRTPCYDADEAGLGKSATAIMAIHSSPGKALIICPPYLKYNWLHELNVWGGPKCSGTIIDSTKLDETYWGADILILPDSLLTDTKIQEKLHLRAPFKWLIVDEAHRYKTDTAQRTAALIGDDKHDGICGLAERSVFMSGTPFPNGRPIELFHLLNRIAPESISHRTLEQYWKTFCGGQSIAHYEYGKPVFQRNLKGASHLNLLRRELREKFMIRHLKKNCLTELGPKTRQLIFLDTPKNILAFEQKHFQHLTLDELLGDHTKNTVMNLATYRKAVGLAKLKPSLEIIIDLLESQSGKLVVSANHIDVVEGLYAALGKYHAVKIRGGMSAAVKNGIVKMFQTHPTCRVMVGNTLSMGLGLTLTKAATLVVVEPDYTPGTNEQMEDRIHRISQDKNVLIKYLVLRNSLDERMLHRAFEKQENIQAMMN